VQYQFGVKILLFAGGFEGKKVGGGFLGWYNAEVFMTRALYYCLLVVSCKGYHEDS
jgi:hypothetical protein